MTAGDAQACNDAIPVLELEQCLRSDYVGSLSTELPSRRSSTGRLESWQMLGKHLRHLSDLKARIGRKQDYILTRIFV